MAISLALVWDPNYSDNLFVEGYINGAVQNKWNTFADYVQHVKIDSPEALAVRLESLGILRRDFADLAQSSTAIDSEITDTICDTRLDQGTLRGGEQQAAAEAEALEIIRGLRIGACKIDGRSYRNAYFLSTSRLLDVIYRNTDGLITWFPENLYRHLSYLTSDVFTVEGSFEALTTNYYAVGVDLVTPQTYRRFFGPQITEARIILEQEKSRYETAVATNVAGKQTGVSDLLKKFDEADDLDKPRFAAQVGWYVARQEEIQRIAAEERANLAAQQLSEAKKTSKREVDELRKELERRDVERKRHFAGRERNLRDPKHSRKRERQARRRKKRK